MAPNTSLFDGIYADVLSLTVRPDLSAETELAIKTATRTAHFSDFYPRDLISESITLPNATYQTSFDIQTLFPRLRGISTIRLLDVNQAPVEYPHIEVVEIGDIYDLDYRTLRNNVAFLAGTSLNVRSAISMQGILIDYYASPKTRNSEYTSWIAQLFPELIIYAAAAEVFNAVGNSDKSQQYMKIVEAKLIPQLKSNFLISQAR